MAYKTLTYKVARFRENTYGNTLQDYLELALGKLRSAQSRQYKPHEASDHFRLINYNGPHKGMRVGEMFDYKAGMAQLVAKHDGGVSEYEISSLAPDEGTDFLQSIMYFGIRKNHVCISQSPQLRSQHFEEYLNWILVEADVINSGNYVSLGDQTPDAEISSTSKIEFHAPINFQAPGLSEMFDVGRKKELIPVSGSGWSALNKMMPQPLQVPERIAADEVLSNGTLDVHLVVSWKGGRRGGGSTDFLDAVSNQLRHVDDEVDYTIHTKNGAKINKSDFKLSRKVHVSEKASGLLDRHDMWIKIKQWYDSLVRDQEIDV